MIKRPDSWEDPPEDDVDADAAEQYAEDYYDRFDKEYPIIDRDCDYWNRIT